MGAKKLTEERNPLKQWFDEEVKRNPEFNQTRLAEELETTNQNVNDWLNDKRLPNPSFVRKIRDRTGLDSDLLINWAAGYDDSL